MCRLILMLAIMMMVVAGAANVQQLLLQRTLWRGQLCNNDEKLSSLDDKGLPFSLTKDTHGSR